MLLSLTSTFLAAIDSGVYASAITKYAVVYNATRLLNAPISAGYITYQSVEYPSDRIASNKDTTDSLYALIVIAVIPLAVIVYYAISNTGTTSGDSSRVGTPAVSENESGLTHKEVMVESVLCHADEANV